MTGIFQDWQANEGNPKGRLVMVLFRVAHALRSGPKWLLPVAAAYGVAYRIGVEWILGIELPWKTKVGAGLRIYHGYGLVVGDESVIGNDCTLRHGTTLGFKILPDGSRSTAPVLGNNVEIGPSVTILGPVKIGDNAVIGAGAVVVKDVPAGAIVAGNPARILKPGAGASPAAGDAKAH